MKRIQLLWSLLLSILLLSAPMYGQVRISDDNSTGIADPSAILHLETELGKGLLLPRVATTTAVTNQKAGMVVFSIADDCVMYYNGAKWISLCTSFSITGTVKDANGNPLAGVTVGDNKGRSATTDINGNFSLVNYLYGDTPTITFSKTGYVFNPINIPAITDNKILGDVNGTANTYSITYDGNKGTPSTQTKSITYNALFTAPITTPICTGYTLIGWNTTADGTGTTYVAGTTKITGDVTVYAQWKAIDYTITYNGNNGTPASQTKILSYGTKFEVPETVPVRTYYMLTGWNTESDGTGIPYIAGSTMITSNIIVYAQWKGIEASNVIINTPNGTSVKTGETLQLTAIVEPSDALNKTITWSIVGINTTGSIINSSTGLITAGSTAGTITVRATIGSIQKDVSITILPNKEEYIEITPGTYTLTGIICYDVAKTDGGTTCGNLSSRTNAFANGYSFTYTFTNSASYNDLVFMVTDENEVKMISGDMVTNTSSKTGTLTFVSTIRDQFTTSGQRKTIGVHALFIDNTGTKKRLSLTVYVQDCQCCQGYLQPGTNLCWYKIDETGQQWSPNDYSGVNTLKCTKANTATGLSWRVPTQAEMASIDLVAWSIANAPTSAEGTVNLGMAGGWSYWCSDQCEAGELGNSSIKDGRGWQLRANNGEGLPACWRKTKYTLLVRCVRDL